RGEGQVRRGAAVHGRVVARDGKTPVAGATIIAGGWPLARSGDDGAFTIAHAPARLRLVAVSGTDAGSAAVDGAKPAEIRLGTAASIGGSVTTKGSAPVAGATVTFAGDGRAEERRVGEEGGTKWRVDAEIADD